MCCRHVEPLAILLVKRGGSGDRILFRYPYSEPTPDHEESPVPNENPYAISDDPDDSSSVTEEVRLNEKNFLSFPSKILSHLCAVHPQICDDKFEVKVDDVRLVGHPMSLEVKPEEAELHFRHASGIHQTTMSMFQVVFVLSSMANYSIVRCYHDLSKMLGVGIKYEDR